jgi:hypothetical protein
MELHETVSRVVPTIGVPPAGVKLAEIVLVPQLTAVAVPAVPAPTLPIVATCILLEDHVAEVVRSSCAPPRSVPKARNCVVCPICGTVGLLGRTAMDWRVWFPVQGTVNSV